MVIRGANESAPSDLGTRHRERFVHLQSLLIDSLESIALALPLIDA